MNIEVTKVNFYENKGGSNLKFIDSTNHKECESHFECCCTKIAKEKPTSRLLSSSISIDAYMDKLDKYKVEIDLTRGSFVFRWDDKHAYFNMLYDGDSYSNRKQKGINIEIYRKDWNCVDYFFAKMFLGNNIDISDFMNGHTPSHLVKLHEIKDDDIWLYDGRWTNEHMRFFDKSTTEWDNWRRSIETSANIKDSMSRFRPESEYTVQEIKHLVNSHKHLKEAVDFCVDWFTLVIEILTTTQLYKLQKEIKEAIDQNK